MAKKDQDILCHWRDAFGKSVRQLTVRNQSTKDNVRTLPLYAYTPEPPVPVPVSFKDVAATADHHPPASATDTPVTHVAPTQELLYPADSVVLLKPGYPLDLHITAPFSLGITSEDVVKDDHCYSVNVTLFLPSFDNCLTFCHQANVTVHRDVIAIEVETAKVIISDNDKSITLSDEDFPTLTRYLQKDTDPEEGRCKEKDLADDSDIEDSQEDDFVLVDSRVMLTLSGRTVRRPMRLDL